MRPLNPPRGMSAPVNPGQPPRYYGSFHSARGTRVDELRASDMSGQYLYVDSNCYGTRWRLPRFIRGPSGILPPILRSSPPSSSGRGVPQRSTEARDIAGRVNCWRGPPLFPPNNRDGNGDGNGRSGDRKGDAIATSVADLDGGNKEGGPAAQDGDEGPGTHHEVYWRNIKSYQQQGEGSRPVVICAICREKELVISELQPRRDDGDQEEIMVFDCGHVVGATCWSQWVKIQADTETIMKCPICNVPIRP